MAIRIDLCSAIKQVKCILHDKKVICVFKTHYIYAISEMKTRVLEIRQTEIGKIHTTKPNKVEVYPFFFYFIALIIIAIACEIVSEMAVHMKNIAHI